MVVGRDASLGYRLGSSGGESSGGAPKPSPVSRVDSAQRPATVLHITTIPMSLVFFRGQLGYMKRRGIAVHILSSPGEELEAFARSEGVPTHCVEMRRRITPLRDLKAVWKIRRVIRHVRPDLVHAHTPKGGLLGILAAWIAGVPVRVYQMRGLPMVTGPWARKWLLRCTEWLSCHLAHRVICNSHSLRRLAVEEGVCPPERCAVLRNGSGNGVDATGRFNPGRVEYGERFEACRRLGIPENALVVGYVGRVVRDKGIVELVDAWRALRSEWPRAHLLVVGPFEAQDPVPSEVAAALTADPRVHLTGLEWDTAPLYSLMDVVVLPTYREGFPNVPLEAAAMELPVVATRVPGCVDAVVDGVTGTLVPPRDSEGLADGIRTYLADPVLRCRHGRAARERVIRGFRPESIWEALYEEYCALLSIHHPPSGAAFGVPETSEADESPGLPATGS